MTIGGKGRIRRGFFSFLISLKEGLAISATHIREPIVDTFDALAKGIREIEARVTRTAEAYSWQAEQYETYAPEMSHKLREYAAGFWKDVAYYAEEARKNEEWVSKNRGRINAHLAARGGRL